MKSKDRDWLGGKLLLLAKHASPVGGKTNSLEFPEYGYGFNEESRDTAWALLDELLDKRGWAAKYSEEHLTQLVAKTIGLLFQKPLHADALVAAEQLIKDWEGFNEVRRVYIPVENLEMKVHELVVGHAHIIRVGPMRSKEFEAGTRKAFAAGPRSTDEAQGFIQMRLDRWKALGSVASRVDVIADARRALEIGMDETRRALDFVNYGASVTQATGFRRAIGIKGDAFRGSREHFTVTSDYRRFSSSADFSTGVGSVRLDGVFKKELRDLGLKRISAILTDPARNDLQEAVIRSLHWYSDAWLQPSIDNELLGLTTALETFFTRRGQRIGTPLAEGVAFVLANNLDDRKAVRDRIKHFYSLRGTVTHGGAKVLTDPGLREYRYYVQHVISVMITNLKNWTSLKNFHEWIEDQRLS